MFVFSTSDQTTGSATAIDIPNFAFPLNMTNQVVEFEFVLIIGSSNASGLRVALTVPVNAQFRAWAMGSGAAKSTLLLDLMTQSGALGATFNTFAGTGNYLSIRGGIQNASFADNVQLQAAKVGGGTATLSAGSYLIWNTMTAL